jgi:hypothetical protein
MSDFIFQFSFLTCINSLIIRTQQVQGGRTERENLE